MRLKTKLIATSSLFALPTACIPFSLTSCGSRFDRVYDLAKSYYSPFERHEAELLTVRQMHDTYLEKIMEEPEIFIDDYYWCRCWTGGTFEPFNFWELLLPQQPSNPSVEKHIMGPSKDFFKSDKQMISNLSITTQDAKIGEENWTFPTLSFTLKINSVIKDSVFIEKLGDEFVTGVLSGGVNCDLKFTHVPFRITKRWVDEEGRESFSAETISFEPFGEWLIGTAPNIPTTRPEEWRIEIACHSYIFGEIQYPTGLTLRIADDYDFGAISDEDNANWTYGRSLSFLSTLCCLFTSSHYLEKVDFKD